MDIDRVILAQYQGEAEKAIAGKHWDGARSWLRKIVAEYEGLDAAHVAKARLDFVTISEYREQAAVLLAKFQYAEARVYLQKIVSEFPKTSEAADAATLIEQTVPIAVKYYRSEGDKNFQPAKQLMVPQTKAAELYRHMYEEDPEGPQADYALAQWGVALGTKGDLKGAIAHLQELLAKFPKSTQLPMAQFNIGLYHGSSKNYASALADMAGVVKQYPDSPQAAEALWYSAFFEAGLNHRDNAVAFLHRLQTNYPNSRRASKAAAFIEDLLN